MEITTRTKADFDLILRDIAAFWESERTSPLHHPLFLYEFGDSAYVIKENGTVVAYLFGFLSQTEYTGYVHLIGVRQSHQHRELGRRLYDHFVTFARRMNAPRSRRSQRPRMTNQFFRCWRA